MNLRADEVELGDRVKDRITGFEGIVTSTTTWLAGCKRIGVTSEGMRDGKPIGGEVFDEPNLKVIKKNVHKQPKMPALAIKLGDKVKDKISGLEGIVTSLSYHLSESLWVGITPDKLHEGKPIEVSSVPINLVEKVIAQKEKEPKNKPTGGDQRIPSRCY